MQKKLNKAPIVGFVRYSQKITFKGGAKDVFEPAYFEYRFTIFTEVTLKSFQQQTNPGFILLMLHSESMPLNIRERFLHLEKENKFLYNVFVEDNVQSFNAAIKDSLQYVDFRAEAALTFRIDNDDAVSKDFIQNLSDLVKRDFIGYTISIPTVLIIKRVAQELYMVEERYYPSNSIGLAYVTSNDNYKTVLEVAEHDRMNEDNPLLLLPQNNLAGLMTINGENAANTIDSSRSKTITTTELADYLKNRNIRDLSLTCLRVFKENDQSSTSRLKEVIKLFLPPVFFSIFRKVRK